MSRRLLTAWLMLVRLVLKETLVPSGRTSSRMSNGPRARIIGDFADVLGGVAVGGGGVIRMAIPSSARPGRPRFACPAEPACRTDAPAYASLVCSSPPRLARQARVAAGTPPASTTASTAPVGRGPRPRRAPAFVAGRARRGGPGAWG